MAGQEGLEPPTRGFGDRCSTNWSYWPTHGASFPLFMRGALPAAGAEFLALQALGILFFVLVRRVITPLAFRTFKLDEFCRHSQKPYFSGPFYKRFYMTKHPRFGSGAFNCGWVYPNISDTTPAPMVRPPSRMANRSSFSMAIGVMSSAVMVVLSPGITISTSLGRFRMPVTSVVRK